MKDLKLYAGQKKNLNQIRNELGLDKMYLYRFVGNYEKIETMPYKVVVGVARLEQIEPDELYYKMLAYAKKGE
jgi:hypothetical protein